MFSLDSSTGPKAPHFLSDDLVVKIASFLRDEFLSWMHLSRGIYVAMKRSLVIWALLYHRVNSRYQLFKGKRLATFNDFVCICKIAESIELETFFIKNKPILCAFVEPNWFVSDEFVFLQSERRGAVFARRASMSPLLMCSILRGGVRGVFIDDHLSVVQSGASTVVYVSSFHFCLSLRYQAADYSFLMNPNQRYLICYSGKYGDFVCIEIPTLEIIAKREAFYISSIHCSDLFLFVTEHSNRSQLLVFNLPRKELVSCSLYFEIHGIFAHELESIILLQELSRSTTVGCFLHHFSIPKAKTVGRVETLNVLEARNSLLRTFRNYFDVRWVGNDLVAVDKKFSHLLIASFS